MRDLPAEFGSWNSVYVRFAHWSDKQVWLKAFAELRQDADLKEVFFGNNHSQLNLSTSKRGIATFCFNWPSIRVLGGRSCIHPTRRP